MKAKLFSSGAFLLLISLLFNQCNDPHARYEDPPWLGGTNIETLEKEGDFSIFLDLMDLSEYRTSIENQLFTLFVPNDSAFEAYFQSQGISSVDDLTPRDAEELFGLHILINPRSRDQMIYEYAWGELESPRGEYESLFHRKQTYSVPQDYSEEVKYNEDFLGEVLKLTRGRVLIPFWTTEFFEDYNGDPEGSDYLFMYPGSGWSGTQWHDAMVTEAAARTSSGFIYYLDRVVAPPPTIETYLNSNQDEFGLFYDIAQKFASYTNAGLDENDVRHYRKSYKQILDFGNDQGPNLGSIENLMLYMFTALVPNDAALQAFLDRTVLVENESIDSVPDLFKVYLINSQLNIQLALPSAIAAGYQNYFGDKISVDINTEIYKTKMTSNGVVYATNKYLEPNAFTCVPGPLFYDREYSILLYALHNSGLLSTVTKPDLDATLFGITNDMMKAYGIRTNTVSNNVIIEIQASDGTWKEIKGDELEELIQDYIHYGRYDDFIGEGYIRMASDNYVYYNNGTISGGGNQVDDDPASVEETLNTVNGNLFILDRAIKEPLNVAEFISSDPDLSSFWDLLVEAGMIDSIQEPFEQPGIEYPRVIGLSALKQWTILAPTNQAITDAELAGLIPQDLDEIADTLKSFLEYHLVRDRAIFDDGGYSGTVESQSYVPSFSGPVYKTIEVTNVKDNLSVEDLTGETVAIDHADANNLVEDGVLHKINSVLLKE